MSFMFVLNFESISRMTLVLRPEKLPRKTGIKAVPFKNDLSMAKIFHMVICLNIPFHP